jgi:hypothetical protein
MSRWLRLHSKRSTRPTFLVHEARTQWQTNEGVDAEQQFCKIELFVLTHWDKKQIEVDA